MEERKIDMQKDGVIKSIDENLESLYLNMGWARVEKAPLSKKSISKED